MGQDGLPLKNFQAFRHFEYGRSNYMFLYKGNRLTPQSHLMSWSYDTGTPTAGHRVSKTCRMPCGPGRWPQNLSYDFPGDSQTLIWRGSQAPFQSQVRKIMLCGRTETGRSMVCPEINQPKLVHELGFQSSVLRRLKAWGHFCVCVRSNF